MSRSKTPGLPPTRLTPPEAEERRFRLEFSLKGIFGYGLGFVALCAWMFVLGVLVGRGVPLVSPEDFSFKAELLRFMGLGKETPPPPANIVETWESPQQMLETLRYYEDLTQKANNAASPSASFPHPVPSPPQHAPAATPPSSGASPPPTPTVNKEPKEAKPQADPALKSKPSAHPPPTAELPSPSAAPQRTSSQPAPSPPEKTAAASPEKTPSEHFTVLVASLRDQDNLKRLLEQLKSKGYSPRVETLDLKEAGKWKRVLIGSFGNREEAMRFVTEFNRKEHLEGMVMRESQ